MYMYIQPIIHKIYDLILCTNYEIPLSLPYLCMHCILNQLHFPLHGHPFLLTPHGVLPRPANLLLCLQVLTGMDLRLFLGYLDLHSCTVNEKKNMVEHSSQS